MPEATLLITVRLPGGRYHGMPEWPPSPFRLYQALIAGAVLGEPRGKTESIRADFEWLEQLPPPWVTVPAQTPARRHGIYVPNNDLDTVGGDPRNIAQIRGASKQIAPRLLPTDGELNYYWQFEDADKPHAERIAAAAERLYRLGRGIDIAYASSRILSAPMAEAHLAETDAAIYRPTQGGDSGSALRTPQPGSFRSLIDREQKWRNRLHGGTLTQPPPPTYDTITYRAPAHRLLFDLIGGDDKTNKFHPIPASRAAWLVTRVRDQLANLLSPSFGQTLVERVIVGRGSGEADKSRRVQLIPLPSIGFQHADRAIRRLLVVAPPDCPIPASELEWAAGTVHLGVSPEGEILDRSQPQLVRATDTSMLEHYGTNEDEPSAVVWRTVTPVAIRVNTRRHSRLNGSERRRRENQVCRAVAGALRHAGIQTPVATIHLQREPFESKGTNADRFDLPTHLTGTQRYHAEITFKRAVTGPLVLGDGRYMGLGLCAPAQHRGPEALVFDLPASFRFAANEHMILTRAVRRALMALSADDKGKIPRLFSGHESDGRPSAPGKHEHIFISSNDLDQDGWLDRIIVIAPWLADWTFEPRTNHRRLFEQIVPTLSWLGGREIGDVELPIPRRPDSDDPFFRASKVWESVTPYLSTTHPKSKMGFSAHISRDIINECLRRGLPRPEHVEIIHCKTGLRGGHVAAEIRLVFSAAIPGPVLLGRGSHSGEGVFKAQAA